MKPLAIWAVGLLVVLGAFAVITNLVRETGRVFVVVDSSFAMQPVWNQVPGELDDIDDQRYSEFALATEKDLVHSWSDQLRLGDVAAFAPCGFDEIESHGEFAEADDLILITTPASCDPATLSGDWEIVNLQP